MGTMNAFSWLLLVIFMFHEFEEIIFIKPWMMKNKRYIKKAHAENKRVPFDFFRSTGSAALAIYEEFIIVSAATLLSCVFDNYIVWYGLAGAFTVHLVVHILFTVKHHLYVPGVITSAIVLIPSCYVLYSAAKMTGYTMQSMLIATVLALALMLLNLLMLHRAVKAFDRWLLKLSAEK
jgi:hypothetical protein